jgi:hypothetical protein
MTLASIFETIAVTFNCFYGQKDDQKAKVKDLLAFNERYNITILSVIDDYVFENLYPKTNQVQCWNVFVVGNDKTFIVSNNTDFNIPDDITNTRGERIPSQELKDFFDEIFEKTLTGQDLQFLMIFSNKTYVVITYYLSNQNKKVIGACAFIQLFDLMPKITDTLRRSVEFQKQFNIGGMPPHD